MAGREAKMTLPTGNRSASVSGLTTRAAFTLVELLLVMTILTCVIAVAMPTLAHFFRGRDLDAEARQMLALTRYAQSRAISEGVPMLLWFDPRQQTYGLEQEPGYADRDLKAVEYRMRESLQFAVINNNFNPRSVANLTTSAGVTAPGLIAAGRLKQAQIHNRHRNLPTIRCEPDGSFSDTSPQALRLTDTDGGTLWLAQSRLRLSYEIQSQFNPLDQFAR